MIREWPQFDVSKIRDFDLFFITVVVFCCVLVLFKLADKYYGN